MGMPSTGCVVCLQKATKGWRGSKAKKAGMYLPLRIALCIGLCIYRPLYTGCYILAVTCRLLHIRIIYRLLCMYLLTTVGCYVLATIYLPRSAGTYRPLYIGRYVSALIYLPLNMGCYLLAVPCCILPCHATPCHNIPCHIHCRNIPCCDIPCSTVSCCSIA